MCSKILFHSVFHSTANITQSGEPQTVGPAEVYAFSERHILFNAFFVHLHHEKTAHGDENRSADKYIAESPLHNRVLHHVGNGTCHAQFTIRKSRRPKPRNLPGSSTGFLPYSPGMTISTPRPNGQNGSNFSKERNTIEFNASLETSLQQFEHGQAAGATTSMHSPTSFSGINTKRRSYR